MKPNLSAEPAASESETTGLAWPRTWRGVYLFVIASFAVWVGLLLALTRTWS